MVRVAAPAVIVACLAAAARPAVAEHRTFTRTFGYATEDVGETEIELASTQTRSSFADGSPQTFALGLTITHGITGRTEAALVQDFAQSTGAGTPADPGAPLRLRETAVRARHRFAERGDRLADLTLLAEAGKLFGASVYRAELRATVARDLGIATVALDPGITLRFGDDVVTPEARAGWAAGISAEVVPELHAGAETWGSFDVETPDQVVASAGPAVSWAPTPALWVTATVGFGLNARTEDIGVRLLVGLLL